MSIEVIAIFTQTDGMVIPGTSPVNVTLPSSLGGTAITQALPLASFAMEIENTINIGSQTSGAGAGKAKFDPITITRKY